MPKSQSAKLLLAISVFSSLIGVALLWLQRQPRLHLELIHVPPSSGLVFATLSGPSFTIEDIFIDDTFRPTLTFGEPERNALYRELLYPIPMAAPTKIGVLIKGTHLGDGEIQQRFYDKPPRSVLIRTSKGVYRVALTPNQPRTVILYR